MLKKIKVIDNLVIVKAACITIKRDQQLISHNKINSDLKA